MAKLFSISVKQKRMILFVAFVAMDVFSYPTVKYVSKLLVGSTGNKVFEEPNFMAAAWLVCLCLLLIAMLKTGFVGKDVYGRRPVRVECMTILFGFAMFAEIANGALCVLLQLPPMPMSQKTREVLTCPLSIPLVVFVGPMLEEFALRGVLLGGMLKSRWKPLLSIFLSAVVFGALHLNIPQGVHAFFCGLSTGYVFYRTHSVWTCILVHTIMNFLAMLKFQTQNLAEADRTSEKGMVPMAILFGIMFIFSLFLAKYERKLAKTERKKYCTYKDFLLKKKKDISDSSPLQTEE